MSRQIQIRRGTATENNNFTGAIGEVTMDTTNKTLRVHDGLTQGGNEIVSKKQFYSYITNCITEIPQDIKLELSSGTLTLKSGSKCYLKTDTSTPSINVTSDLTTTQTTNGTYFAIYDGSNLTSILTTAYDYSTLPNTYSLPLAVVTVSGGAISSIDQVFNGFGYIGSTVFALPGVKGLIPNGRNADGTLKNTSFTTSSVLINTITSTYSSLTNIRISGSSLQIGSLVYDETYNYNRLSAGGDTRAYATAGYITTTSGGKITSFSTKYAFRAVNYSDTEYIANQAMPSDRYVDLTLGTSGATYTAPADGYFTIAKTSGVANAYLSIDVVSNNERIINAFTETSTTTRGLALSVPVSKGNVVYVYYNATGTTNRFRFVYANGSK